MTATLTATEADNDPRGVSILCRRGELNKFDGTDGSGNRVGGLPRAAEQPAHRRNMTLTVTRVSGDSDISVKPNNELKLTFMPADVEHP